MTSADVALLITAIGGSVAAIITSIAALVNARNNAARMDLLEKENKRLSDENESKSFHNDMQDQVILDQNHKIGQWMAWGERIGRKMNQMELQIGAEHNKKQDNDTQPVKVTKKKDWITGTLGPIDVSDLHIEE